MRGEGPELELKKSWELRFHMLVFRDSLTPSSIKKDLKFSLKLLLPIIKLSKTFVCPSVKWGWKLSCSFYGVLQG